MKLSNFILIDDEPANNLICKININRVFHEANVVSFTTPQDGVQYLRSTPQTDLHDAVVLLDLNMPNMDGFEVLDELESFINPAEKHMQVYVLSSTINENEIARSIENTLVSGFIEKPLTEEKLNELFGPRPEGMFNSFL